MLFSQDGWRLILFYHGNVYQLAHQVTQHTEAFPKLNLAICCCGVCTGLQCQLRWNALEKFYAITAQNRDALLAGFVDVFDIAAIASRSAWSPREALGAYACCDEWCRLSICHTPSEVRYFALDC